MNRLEQLEDFLAQHQYTIANALNVYAERMQETSDKTMAAYNAIKDKPDEREAQDRTFVTTEGLRMSAELFADSAQRAKTALLALEALDADEEQ